MSNNIALVVIVVPFMAMVFGLWAYYLYLIYRTPRRK
jgi:hypothetical protein